MRKEEEPEGEEGEELVVVEDGELVAVQELVAVVEEVWGEGQGRDRGRVETVFAQSVEPRCPTKEGCRAMNINVQNAKVIW